MHLRIPVFAASITVALLAQSAPPAAASEPAKSDVIAKYDTDKDQTLSLDEVKAAASAHFGKLDKESNGTLEANEVRHVLGTTAFRKADTDKDGTLSKDEYLALVEKLFALADRDHDGTLNAQELQSKQALQLNHLID